jgi:hypothetical protein
MGVGQQQAHRTARMVRQATPALREHVAAQIEPPEFDGQPRRQIAVEEGQIAAGADANLEHARRPPTVSDTQPVELEAAHVALADGALGRELEKRQEDACGGIVPRSEQAVEEAHEAVASPDVRLVDEVGKAIVHGPAARAAPAVQLATIEVSARERAPELHAPAARRADEDGDVLGPHGQRADRRSSSRRASSSSVAAPSLSKTSAA